MRIMLRYSIVATFIVAAFASAPALPTAAQSVGDVLLAPDLYGELHWRNLGPEGNRFSAAAGHPR